MKAEYVGAGVMAHHVEGVLGAHDFVEIDLRREDGGPLEVGSGEDLAGRGDDGAAPAHQDGLGVVSLEGVVILGAVAAREILAGGQDETAALPRDVLHGGQPGVAAVRRRGEIDLDAF